ncbi:signal peptidase I [Patescibacteria group bacterium]|nr:signal peptidase I [Patescibacteria group bacterium]
MSNYWKETGQFLSEVIKVGLISLAIILPVRYFLVQPFYVKGESMEPTYLNSDYLLIDEISFRFREVKRGEVVVLRYPRNEREFFIKRIIGLPHDRVVIKEGAVWLAINGQSLEKITEDYLPTGVITQGDQDITLQIDQYYVLGDNRGASLDSRSFGPIIKREIVGRSWLRAWPFDRLAIFNLSVIN